MTKNNAPDRNTGARYIVILDDEAREHAPHSPWTATAHHEDAWPASPADAIAAGYGATIGQALRGLANTLDSQGRTG